MNRARGNQSSSDGLPSPDSPPSPAEEAPHFVLWIPGIGPRQMEHCVTFMQVAQTNRAGSGVYLSLCDVRFTPAASMTTPPWPHCPDCTQRHKQWRNDWNRAHKPRRRGRPRWGRTFRRNRHDGEPQP
jgi:hypothetical protein